MKHINSAQFDPSKLNSTELHLLYNGLDAALTKEIYGVLVKQLQVEGRQHTYDFEKSLLPCVLKMMARGILIDQEKAREAVEGPDGLSARAALYRQHFLFLAEHSVMDWAK